MHLCIECIEVNGEYIEFQNGTGLRIDNFFVLSEFYLDAPVVLEDQIVYRSRVYLHGIMCGTSLK